MKKTAPNRGKKLHHWCPKCREIVARKKDEPLYLLGRCKCTHSTCHWIRMYI